MQSITVRCLFAIVLAAGVSPAQQPNTAAASLTFGGLNGPNWPILLPLNVAALGGGPLDVEVRGAPNSPFLLTLAPAGITSPGLNTGLGILDQDLSQGLEVVLDGTGLTGGGSPFLSFFVNTGPSGTWNLPLPTSAATAGISGGLQALVVDPSNPLGFSVTAATFLTTVNVPVNQVYVSHSLGQTGRRPRFYPGASLIGVIPFELLGGDHRPIARPLCNQ